MPALFWILYKCQNSDVGLIYIRKKNEKRNSELWASSNDVSGQHNDEGQLEMKLSGGDVAKDKWYWQWRSEGPAGPATAGGWRGPPGRSSHRNP